MILTKITAAEDFSSIALILRVIFLDRGRKWVQKSFYVSGSFENDLPDIHIQT